MITYLLLAALAVIPFFADDIDEFIRRHNLP